MLASKLQMLNIAKDPGCQLFQELADTANVKLVGFMNVGAGCYVTLMVSAGELYDGVALLVYTNAVVKVRIENGYAMKFTLYLLEDKAPRQLTTDDATFHLAAFKAACKDDKMTAAKLYKECNPAADPNFKLVKHIEMTTKYGTKKGAKA